MKKNSVFFADIIWLLALILIMSFLLFDKSRVAFEFASRNYPVAMGFAKFFILASMGELLGRRISSKAWSLKGINLFQRALVWGIIGISLTYVFPIFSAGVDTLMKAGRLPAIPGKFGLVVSAAFFKSFFMNALYAFPMMSCHRFTDTLIDKNALFKKWDVVRTFNQIDWKNMITKVGPTIVWFWIPAQTVTFCLPPQYRILMAALLGIVLGIILSFLKSTSD